MTPPPNETTRHLDEAERRRSEVQEARDQLVNLLGERVAAAIETFVIANGNEERWMFRATRPDEPPIRQPIWGTWAVAADPAIGRDRAVYHCTVCGTAGSPCEHFRSGMKRPDEPERDGGGPVGRATKLHNFGGGDAKSICKLCGLRRAFVNLYIDCPGSDGASAGIPDVLPAGTRWHDGKRWRKMASEARLVDGVYVWREQGEQWEAPLKDIDRSTLPAPVTAKGEGAEGLDVFGRLVARRFDPREDSDGHGMTWRLHAREWRTIERLAASEPTPSTAEPAGGGEPSDSGLHHIESTAWGEWFKDGGLGDHRAHMQRALFNAGAKRNAERVEQAEKLAKEQGRSACSLFDEVKRLQGENHNLDAELREARGTIAAWEPVVMAAIAWNTIREMDETENGFPQCDELEKAVDALPPERRPTPPTSDS